MLIPSAAQVRDAILKIQPGSSVTLNSIRRDLAKEAGMDITCSFGARTAWLAVAFASEEDESYAAPWWRVTREGSPYAKLPGGEEGHRDRLLAEGVQI
jgi:alkylated DNA nucleotide flippase Atl1